MQNHDWQKVELQFCQAAFDSEITNNTMPGISEQAEGIWAVLVNCPGGVLEPDQFSTLAKIVAEMGVGVKLTGRQAPVLLLPKNRVPEALKLLAEKDLKPSFIHGSLRNIKACIGSMGCKNARKSDVVRIAKSIDHAFYGVILPWDCKIAISGCTRNCASATCQSIGFIETSQGFDLYLGGSEGVHSGARGTLITGNIPEQKITKVVETLLKCYIWAAQELILKGRIGNHPHFAEVFIKMGREFFAEAVDTVLEKNLSNEVAATAYTDAAVKLPGFNKENTFSAFLALNKLCAHCPECKKFKCHLFIAKDLLSEAARTGRKFLDKIPSDMINLLRALPIAADRFEQFKLLDAYHNISDICDQCQIADHDSLCTVNISLTAIGYLINGSNFITLKDKEKQSLSL